MEAHRQLQERVLRQAGLRIEPEMVAFLANKLASPGNCLVIGGDARTGVPRRQMVNASALEAGAQRRPTSSYPASQARQSALASTI